MAAASVLAAAIFVAGLASWFGSWSGEAGPSSQVARVTAVAVPGFLLVAMAWLLWSGLARSVRLAHRLNRDLLRTNAALKASERRFRTMADGAPALIWRSVTDQRRTWFNRPWLEFTGRSQEQEQGDGWTEGIHPDDRQRCLDLQAALFEQRRPFTVEYRLRCADGTYRWIVDAGKPLLDEAGVFSGYIGSGLDVTARREAESRVQESEEKYRRLVESSHDIIYTLDAAGVFTFASPSFQRLLGWPVEEVVGSHFVRFTHPDDVPRCVAFLGQVLESGHRQGDFEHRVLHRDGSWRWMLTNAVPLHDPQGRAAGMEGSASEIDARKSLQARVARTERAAALGTLAAGMAHELNNPLTPVLAGIEFAREYLATPGEPGRSQARGGDELGLEEVRQSLADAAEGARRVRGLVADLRSFALGQHSTDARCDLASAIDRACRVARHAHVEGATLSVKIPPAASVSGSEAELVQLFAALLVNAEQATDERPNHVRVTAERRGEDLLVRIDDTGRGIPAKDLARVFDPFFTTRKVGMGRGLGLPVAQGIAQGLGGGIEVESVEGQGTTVTVTLPIGA